MFSALSEYDELGQAEFLARYQFKPAREYLLLHDGKEYDSKAVLGVAYKYATGRPLDAAEFSGGRDETARLLRDLGFEVIGGSSTEGPEDAMPPVEAWAEVAREVLIVTAKHYHSVITYKELAEEVQQRTGVYTRSLLHNWIGKVLGRVASECGKRGEPILSALCVNQAGSVGAGYGSAVLDVRGEVPGDPDDHAAHERFACHRHFGAKLPADGGRPALVPKLAASRIRVAKTKYVAPVGETCPKCHTMMSLSGVCGNCD